MTKPLGRSRERGTVLVLFALFVFAFVAMLAAIVDVGTARVAQSTLQNAADVAALEGLRQRDAVLGLPPEQADEARRALARIMVQRHFDADGDLSTSNETEGITLGAGPQYIVTTAEDGIRTDVAVANPAAYRPLPALNTENTRFGDFVAGEFLEDVRGARESSSYVRDDFIPAALTQAATGEAFLARLRRTRTPVGTVDFDRVPGVSTSGGEIPYLFGRAIPWQTGPGGNPRADGINVRATAIAEERLALRIGVRVGDAPGALIVGFDAAGRALLSFDALSWPACVPSTTAVRLRVRADQGRVVAVNGPCAGDLVGQLHGGLQVGTVDTVQPPVTVTTPPTGLVYASVHRTTGGGPQVIGFVALTLEAALETNGDLLLEVRRRGSTVAPASATAQSGNARRALVADPSLSAALGSLDDALLAPVLVR